MELSIVLQNPPIGIKEGLVNLLMLSVLKANGDAILLYEHGSLIIDIDDAVAERMLRNPSHFAIKNLQSSGGKNTDLVTILGNRLAVGGEGSKATLLDVARKIYREVQSLPAYSLQSTLRFSSGAVEVRKAIKSASELDVLLFTALPAALGVSDLSEQSSVSKKVKDDFADKLFDVLEELKGSYDELLTHLSNELAKELQRPGFTVAELREELRNSAGQLKGRVLEKKLNAFVHGIYRDDLAEKEWIANLAMIIAGGQPAKIWTDETLTLFDFSVKEVCGAFFRLNQLLFHSLESRTPGTAMYRVTVTDQEGNELVRTVSATQLEVASAKKIVDDAISEVSKIVRSDARSLELIMAILGGAGSELAERRIASREKESDGTQG
jgi:cell division protein ZapA (FtsZ GTPase activity inhibitor)